jgi:cytochrome bd-type quinol oxidase subunit 2
MSSCRPLSLVIVVAGLVCGPALAQTASTPPQHVPLLTVASPAAPDVSLKFLFYGGIVVLPVIALYTIGVYWVFRGKVREG